MASKPRGHLLRRRGGSRLGATHYQPRCKCGWPLEKGKHIGLCRICKTKLREQGLEVEP